MGMFSPEVSTWYKNPKEALSNILNFSSFRHFCSLKALSTGVQGEESRHDSPKNLTQDTEIPMFCFILLRSRSIQAPAEKPSGTVGILTFKWNNIIELGNKNVEEDFDVVN